MQRMRVNRCGQLVPDNRGRKRTMIIIALKASKYSREEVIDIVLQTVDWEEEELDELLAQIIEKPTTDTSMRWYRPDDEPELDEPERTEPANPYLLDGEELERAEQRAKAGTR